MKKTKLLLCVGIFLLAFISFGLSIKVDANSAAIASPQPGYEISMDGESSDIEIASEVLTFTEKPIDPEYYVKFRSYYTNFMQVSAAYDMIVPTARKVTMGFPLVSSMKVIQNHDYRIFVNGKEVPCEIYRGDEVSYYAENYEDYSFVDMLKQFDTTDYVLPDDIVVNKYMVTEGSLEIIARLDENSKFITDIGYHYLSEAVKFEYANEYDATPQSHFIYAINSQLTVPAKYLKSTVTLDKAGFLADFKAYDSTIDEKEIAKFYHDNSETVLNCRGIISGETSRLFMFVYEADLMAGENTMEVRYAMAFGFNPNNSPDTYRALYFTSPAKHWAKFGELKVVINTDKYLIEGNQKYQKTESGYEVTLPKLPDKNIEFVLCESENPRDYMGCGAATSFAKVVVAISTITIVALIIKKSVATTH